MIVNNKPGTKSRLFEMMEKVNKVKLNENIYSDAQKEQSMPFGGDGQTMQTGINYADNKPTNSSVRVKAPELEKVVENDVTDDIYKALEPVNKYDTLRKEEILSHTLQTLKNRAGDPNYKPTKEEFMAELTKTVPKHKLGFMNEIVSNESTDSDKYEDVVFLQGDEADEPLEILNTQGKDAAMEYLKQWHNPGQHMGRNESGHGSSDQTYEKDGYIMSWNSRLGYIGLEYDLSQMNEENDEPETNDGMSLEPKGDEITQLAQDKEENGEVLIGGKGDGKSPLEFDPEQVLKGLEVEKEHTDDNLIAIEIVLDHLTEDPEYYTRKDDPEASAQVGASADAENGNIVIGMSHATDTITGDGMAQPHGYSGEEKPEVEKENPELYPDGWKEMDGMFMNPNSPTSKSANDVEDKETTDELLGYKPMNVGEEFDYASAERDYEDSNEYKKFQQYQAMDWDSLNDQQKEEYFELWKTYHRGE